MQHRVLVLTLAASLAGLLTGIPATQALASGPKRTDAREASAVEGAPAGTREAGAVPLAEVPARAEFTAALLRDTEAALASKAPVFEIEAELPRLVREIDVRLRETVRILAQSPSMQLLERQQADWRQVRETVLRWGAALEQRAARLDRDRRRLAGLETSWRETLARAREAGDPELIGRIERVLATLGRTQASLEAQHAALLKLHGRVTAQDLRIGDALDRLRQEREAILARLFRRESPPAWHADAWRRDSGRIDSAQSWQAQRAALEDYVARHGGRIVLHIVVMALLAGALYRLRARAGALAARNPALERVVRVVSTPVAIAFVLSCLVAPWIYPAAPRLLWAIVAAVALFPTIEVLRPLVEPHLRLLLHATAAFFVFDQVRAVAAAMPALPRFLFLVEMLAAALVMLLFVARSRAAAAREPEQAARIARHRAAGWLACAVFTASAVANAGGYVTLAYLLGNALLGAAYFGLVLYALVRILDALATFALQTAPLDRLGIVRRHGAMLGRRFRLALAFAAAVAWVVFLLERLALREPLFDAVARVLAVEIPVGTFRFSPGDGLLFVLVVWAAFLVSRLVRFLLEEEVYPRSTMERGLHYAISRTLHYLILVAGFLFAAAVLGFDMTKFTILAGAFTVGVGFGLQNVFNNFVSGLILLFERPIRVGDMIQIDDASGIVERIGIRASVVRSTAGYGIIVPNGRLISERLVNWTLSDRRRGFELPLAVAHGADPREVIATLERVAGAHPGIAREPRPEALLTRLGPDWMGFELRAYTEDLEQWPRVRSELAVAVSEALRAKGIALK